MPPGAEQKQILQHSTLFPFLILSWVWYILQTTPSKPFKDWYKNYIENNNSDKFSSVVHGWLDFYQGSYRDVFRTKSSAFNYFCKNLYRQQTINCLSVFYHFRGFTLKRLKWGFQNISGQCPYQKMTFRVHNLIFQYFKGLYEGALWHFLKHCKAWRARLSFYFLSQNVLRIHKNKPEIEVINSLALNNLEPCNVWGKLWFTTCKTAEAAPEVLY